MPRAHELEPFQQHIFIMNIQFTGTPGSQATFQDIYVRDQLAQSQIS